MKKALLSLVAFVAISTASYAQLSVGLRAGLNLADNKFSSGSFEINPDMKAGFLAGLYLTANLSEKVALQPELQFATFGSKGDDFGDVDLSYVTIPVLVRYNFNEMINLHVGPQFNMLMSADVDGEDIKEELKGTDFGLIVGVGADFGKFNAGLRYFGGLSDISDIDDADIEIKNNAFQLVLGYRLFGGN